MKHRAASILSLLLLSLACGPPTATIAAVAAQPAGPNILWIVADDLSPALGCYGDGFAQTPFLDRLATQSVLYTHAFATAPVCSPSRSCLINGVYAPTQGTHNMRSAFPIPEGMTGFPHLLRQAGYYTTNNSKTDYNSAAWEKIIQSSWDESSPGAHWRNRRHGQPFFSIFNLMTTHQSRAMVWPHERFVAEVQSQLRPDEIHDPTQAPVPPFYPDTPVIRKTLARYYDCITAMDRQVGRLLEQLEEDGLADSTIVFFYSDHGSGLPRHKRTLLDSGLRVPLLVRIPKQWRQLAPHMPGESTDSMVSFVDFAPTMLNLAGVDIPQYMQGLPFLGSGRLGPRKYAYGHRDRVDEVIDMARSVRGRRYLYIRNFMPHLGYNQPSAWPDLGEVRHEFYRLTSRETMTAAQWHFAGPTRPREELYDCEQDPHNLTNLALSVLPQHTESLDRMRRRLHDHLIETRDLGFIPEAEMWRRIGDDRLPMELLSADDEDYLSRLIGVASLVGRRVTEHDLVRFLDDEDPAIRYWVCVALAASKRLSDNGQSALEDALDDSAANVRIEAAHALARHGHLDKALPVLIESLNESNLTAVLHAARTIQLLGAPAAAAAPAMRRTDSRLKGLRPRDIPATVVQPGELDMAMFIGFSIQAFLDAVEDRPQKGNE